MRKAIIKKKENGWYFACCEKTNAILAAGETEQDCIDIFCDKMELPDYGLFKKVNSAN